jgi:hypothetical protein|tara:strand:+ start:419 stop:676 length:258 start_codon:yes stop_codon:yes gene_type:complete
MKKFLIKIRAYGYLTEFTVMAENSSQGIENAILDKLGKNDINWETSNFYSLTKQWLTFEEINDDKLTRPVQTEKVSGVELGAGAS